MARALFLCLTGLLLGGCQLAQEEKVRNTLSFESLYDSLARFDSVQIEVRDASGNLLDRVYAGKVDTLAEIEDLPAPHWDGGKALIVISGFRQGSPDPIYRVELTFDGRTDATESNRVVIHPDLIQSLELDRDTLFLEAGGPARAFVLAVTPSTARADVVWRLADSTIAAPSPVGGFRGLQSGSTRVWVSPRLKASPGDSALIVVSRPGIPAVLVQRVEVSPDTLVLYRGGSGKTVAAKVHPDTAPSAVRWESTSPSVATVSQQGEISPLGSGYTEIVAVSLADTSKRDTVRVSVKVDAPRLRVGSDTVLTSGQTLAFTPAVTQEYGGIAQFKWDLDGDLEWDDSSASLREVSFRYDQVKEHAARFLVRDSEGNLSLVSVKILVVMAAAVVIHSPPDNFQTNKPAIAVAWSVDGVRQDSLLTETLRVGANTISRSARDKAGSLSTASVTVILDTIPPSPPGLTGTSPTNVQPLWRWSSGGGMGEYRFRLGAGDFPPDAPTTRDTAFVLKEPAAAGATYTLSLQERDPAGNWSASAVLAIRFDNTKPVVAILQPQASGTFHTAAATVVLSGTALGPMPMQRVTYSLDGGAAAPAVLDPKGAWTTPALPLSEGKPAALLIRAVDSLGNTGEAGLGVLRDNTAPAAPAITASPAPAIKSATGTWSWSPGVGDAAGSGLNGNYRYRLDNYAWSETHAASVADLLLREGANVFQVQAQDRAGNWSASALDSVKVDTRGPSVAITSPVATGGSYTSTAAVSVEIRGTVADSGVGVKEVVCEWGVPARSMVAALDGPGWKVTPTFSPGTSTVWCTGYDQFDKAGVPVSIDVTVAIPLPVISNLDVADGMVMNTRTFTVSFDATVAGKTSRESAPVTLAEGINPPIVLTSKAVNLLGEPGTLRVTYVLRSKAVFVDRLAKGRGDGSSWANAHATLQEAARNPLFTGGGAQLWISKGGYAGTVDTVHLPSTGRILGGFDATLLPADTSNPHRNPGLHKVVLENFLFSLDTLAGRFEFCGLETFGGRLDANLGSAPSNQNGVIAWTNATFRYSSTLNQVLSFKGSEAIRVELTGCETAQADTSAGSNFRIAFEVPGTFAAKGSRFIKAPKRGSYSSFLYANYTASSQYQSLEFENCELNYYVEDYRVFNYQVFAPNALSHVSISKSKVLAGKDRISAAGSFNYDDASNVTIPYVYATD